MRVPILSRTVVVDVFLSFVINLSKGVEILPQTLLILICFQPVIIFQIINSVNIVSLKYQRFTTSGWKYIGIRKLEFVAKLNSSRNYRKCNVSCMSDLIGILKTFV